MGTEDEGFRDSDGAAGRIFSYSMIAIVNMSSS